jgi:hypothetical protein
MAPSGRRNTSSGISLLHHMGEFVRQKFEAGTRPSLILPFIEDNVITERVGERID